MIVNRRTGNTSASTLAASSGRHVPSRVNGHGKNGNGAAALASPATSRALVSDLIERAAFATGVGLTYAGYRNMRVQLGYLETLTFADYRHLHRRGGIAKRVIEAYPKATWSTDARLTEDVNNNTQTPFERAIAELFDRLDVWARIERTDILANIGSYACLLIGATGKLDTPLPSRLKDILYLTPLGENHATIQSWDTDKTSPRYGLPLTYQVSLGGDPLFQRGTAFVNSSRTAESIVVHWSRILHVAEGLLEDDVFGTPRLEAVWNNLDDLVKVVGGGAEAAWKRMDPGIQLDVDPELPLDEDAMDALEEQADEYVHGLRRMLQTRGTKMNLLSTTVAGFGPNATSILQLISGTTGIPQRILTGSERGELASTQDRDNWWDRINERRRAFAAPLVREFVNRLIERGVVPAPKSTSTSGATVAGLAARRIERRLVAGKPTEVRCFVVPVTYYNPYSHINTGRYSYMVSWPEVGPLDSAATAEILSKIAGANQANAQAGGGLILTADETRHYVLGLGPRPKEAETPQTGSGAPVPAKSDKKKVGDKGANKTPKKVATDV
jgi:uncharacterized protein